MSVLGALTRPRSPISISEPRYAQSIEPRLAQHVGVAEDLEGQPKFLRAAALQAALFTGNVFDHSAAEQNLECHLRTNVETIGRDAQGMNVIAIEGAEAVGAVLDFHAQKQPDGAAINGLINPVEEGHRLGILLARIARALHQMTARAQLGQKGRQQLYWIMAVGRDDDAVRAGGIGHAETDEAAEAAMPPLAGKDPDVQRRVVRHQLLSHV